ncbi:sugar phosphate isomerase/epimerase [Faecalicatena contorta]|uniref:sugar phosphate isomerase/epimerase family protein n=1 Tax=Faecalicatena contorta TaxID=39482 RepID=UPI00129DD3E4|nr:sugar phosphate isomerase/epimerase family protein [Faecalicatena contorta]MEE0200176.1 sugar phosphate isomerase/epimerase family protein [Muricomes sp.]MRM89816.1 sugar phosphate isomerase/epimerase [Faecalicatena contorta]
MAIKIGCTVWTFMQPGYHAPYEEAIRKAADVGFEGIELMVDDEKELEAYWTEAKTEEIKLLLKQLKLDLIQICIFQNLAGGFASLEKADSEKALYNFRKVCRLAKKLGAPAVNFPVPYPENDIQAKTTATLPEYFYLNTPDMVLPGGETRCVDGWRFDAKFRLYFPADFKWEKYWENFVENMKKVSEIAASEGVSCRIENTYNTMAPHTDSILRLLKRVESDVLSVSFHSAQAFLQREILPWAVHKYGRKMTHFRACDGDGLACYNLPVGSGIIDWEGVLSALQEIGYDGYLSFEWLNDADIEENAAESLGYIRKKMEKVYNH